MKLELAAAFVLLAGCTTEQARPSAERAAAGYLAIHNDQDHEAARALWGDEADGVESLIAWFHAQVGDCDHFEPMQVTSELAARYVFACERGELEVYLRVDAETGAVRRTLFGARGIEPPPEVRRTAEQLVARANQKTGGEPGEAVALPKLVKRLDAAKVDEQIAAIAVHGQCRIDRVHLGNARGARFVLECSDGSVTMTLDLSRSGKLRRFFVEDGAADSWRRYPV